MQDTIATESGRLLVVNGNSASRASLSRRLEQLGYAVVVAEGGRQALDRLGAQEIDLVLLDPEVSMTNGHPVLAYLKADSTLRQIPVIVLSGADGIEGIEQSIEMGAEDYLPEPFNPVLLKARIEAILEKKRLRDAEKLANNLIQAIVPLGVALSAEKDFDRLLERILVEAKSICHADAGTLYLRTEDDHLKFAIMRTDSLNIAMGGTTGKEIPLPPLHLYDEATGTPNHQNVATHVALEGKSINIPDIYHAKGFDFSGTRTFDERNNYRSTSSLTVPLKNYDNAVIGVLQLLNAQDPRTGQVIPFDDYLEQVVESLASQAAVALNNQLLLKRQAELVKFERELQIGRQIQLNFLPDPDRLPQPAGWELAARFEPARQVSGDFYDVFPLPGSHLGLVLADVCNKGVGAALFMALFRSLLRAFSQQSAGRGLAGLGDDDPSSLTSPIGRRLVTLLADFNALHTVVLTNNYVARNHSDSYMFVTLFFGVLDPATGLLTYVNGGHDAPAVIGPDGVKARLNPTGPVVGMMPDTNFDLSEIRLEPGDTLFAYTDGIPEARAPGGEFFTEARLMSLLGQPISSAPALVNRIESDVRAHIATADQFDDITMLAVRRTVVAEG
jgi:sigma-B regulation protein RsbU (phosphoserine phosphatase)